MISVANLLRGSTVALGAAPQAPDAQLLDLDGTVFIMLAIFVLLLLVLWQLVWKPYLRVRDERVMRVDGAKEKAAELERDAAERIARIESALAEARRGGNVETAKLRNQAQAREQQILAEAQEAARNLMVESRKKLDAALVTEKANLQSDTVVLARQIAEKTLNRRMTS